MTELGNILEKKMPMDRVVAECGDCGEELYDSLKSEGRSPRITGNIISVEATAHRSKVGHDDLQLYIEKTTPVEEIDCTITVNE